MNWYRTRKINHQDELSLEKKTIDVPVLFIQALRDAALPPSLGKTMGKSLPNLVTKPVDTSHWALWEKPHDVNVILDNWLDEVVEVGDSKAKL